MNDDTVTMTIRQWLESLSDREIRDAVEALADPETGPEFRREVLEQWTAKDHPENPNPEPINEEWRNWKSPTLLFFEIIQREMGICFLIDVPTSQIWIGPLTLLALAFRDERFKPVVEAAYKKATKKKVLEIGPTLAYNGQLLAQQRDPMGYTGQLIRIAAKTEQAREDIVAHSVYALIEFLKFFSPGL